MASKGKGGVRLERGLLVAVDHNRITMSPTNNSPGKAAWTLPKGARFSW